MLRLTCYGMRVSQKIEDKLKEDFKFEQTKSQLRQETGPLLLV